MQIHKVKAIADLIASDEYHFVLGQVREDLDVLEQKLEASQNSELIIPLKAEWAAYRKILRKLNSVPIEHQEKLDDYLNEHPEDAGVLSRDLPSDIDVE